jgi:hypothetical protein
MPGTASNLFPFDLNPQFAQLFLQALAVQANGGSRTGNIAAVFVKFTLDIRNFKLSPSLSVVIDSQAPHVHGKSLPRRTF